MNRAVNITTDVLIVGAGPTGLMLACQLARFGVKFEILDSKSGPTHESRALTVTSRSLEIYQQLGLDKQIMESSVGLSGFKVQNKGKVIARARLGNIDTSLSDFNQVLTIFEQSKNESLLNNYLQQHKKQVLWNSNFLNYSRSNNNLVTSITTNDGNLNIQCRYLIGCDGAGSQIRKQSKFSFEGGTYENIFYVADTIIESDNLNHEEIVLVPGANVFSAFFPMEGQKRFRIVGTLPDEIRDKENVTFSDIKKSISENFVQPISFQETAWFSTYKLHHRCVHSFRKDNIFLAGDSAHIHSPAGGQGMNTGLQDAHNLGWKLAMVLLYGCDTKLLDTYNEERLPFAKWLLGSTDRGFRIITSKSKLVRIFREVILFRLMSLGFSLSGLRKRIFQTVSQVWYSYDRFSLSKHLTKQKLTFQAGERIPRVRPRYLDQFSKPVFTIIAIGQESTIKFCPEILHLPLDTQEEILNEEWQQYGVSAPCYIVLRPDQYILGIADEWTPEVQQSLFAQFLLPHRKVS